MKFHGTAKDFLSNYDSPCKIKEIDEEEKEPADAPDLASAVGEGSTPEERPDEDVEEREGAKEVPQALLPTSWTKIDQIITLLQNRPDESGEFFYLTPDAESDPYVLKPNIMSCDYENSRKYFTISKNGITTYIDTEPVDFTSLNEWLLER